MITLAPFLKTRGGREKSPDEGRAEALNRIAAVLLQGIARHGFNYEPAAFALFGNAMKKLREDFEQAADETEALLAACGAIRLLEQHHEAAQQRLNARQNEMEAAMALLSETVLEVARAAPDVILRLREIERDLSLSARLEGMPYARSRLEACLGRLRAEALAHPSKGRLPAGSGEGTEAVAGLPQTSPAAGAIVKIWSRRMEYYAAVFALERLETIHTRFGFAAAEQMLELLGRHIAGRMTPEDQLFRWRGPCFLVLMERRLPETQVAAELARLAPVRLEGALTIREREVMVSISAVWNLIPLHSLSEPEDLVRRLNEFAASRWQPGRMVSAAAM